VLGSAAGGGFPQWNCNCSGCRRARSGDKKALPRTQSSLAVTLDGTSWYLLNASPDLRQQMGSYAFFHPRSGARDSPVVGAVLTGGDVDHVAGLLDLRESQPLSLFATARVQAVLQANSIFGVLAANHVIRRELKLEQPTELCDAAGRASGLRVTAFTVPGKVALYLENLAAGPGFGTQPGDIIGLEVVAAGKNRRFFYIPGCAAMTPELSRRLRGAPLAFFDGTLWRDDEMIVAGMGTKTGQRMGHISMAGADGTIAAFAGLDVGRKIFIHINNTNPVLLDDSPERDAATAAGWQVAHDGMEVVP
jgi:pyrroloquinoline quinone biosynthesis protein B